MSRFQLNDGRIIQHDQAFEQDELNYVSGPGRLTQEERDAMGITEVVDPPRADDRFYWIGEDGAATPKDLVTLKVTAVSSVKQTARSVLSAWDWRVIRSASGGAALSEEQVSAMQAVRAYSNTLEAEIAAISDVPALEAWTKEPKNWPELA